MTQITDIIYLSTSDNTVAALRPILQIPAPYTPQVNLFIYPACQCCARATRHPSIADLRCPPWYTLVPATPNDHALQLPGVESGAPDIPCSCVGRAREVASVPASACHYMSQAEQPSTPFLHVGAGFTTHSEQHTLRAGKTYIDLHRARPSNCLGMGECLIDVVDRSKWHSAHTSSSSIPISQT